MRSSARRLSGRHTVTDFCRLSKPGFTVFQRVGIQGSGPGRQAKEQSVAPESKIPTEASGTVPRGSYLTRLTVPDWRQRQQVADASRDFLNQDVPSPSALRAPRSEAGKNDGTRLSQDIPGFIDRFQSRKIETIYKEGFCIAHLMAQNHPTWLLPLPTTGASNLARQPDPHAQYAKRSRNRPRNNRG